MSNLLYVVGLALLIVGCIVSALESKKYRREVSLLWTSTLAWLLGSISLASFYYIEGFTVISILAVFFTGAGFSTFLKRAVQQQWRLVDNYGVLPSMREAKRDFEESAQLAWLSALGELPEWEPEDDT